MLKAKHLLVPVVLTLSCGPGPVEPAPEAGQSRIERRVAAMGTELIVVVDAPIRPTALEASEAALAALKAAETRLSTWKADSELSHANRAPLGEQMRLSPQLARDLSGALECARRTDGAFTPGIGALVETWALRSGGRLPTEEEIAEARAAGSLSHVTLAGNGLTRRSERFVFEEGGFGKGVGLDDATVALAAAGATGAVLDLGGQITVWGDATADVAIADPRRRARTVLRLNVSHGSVATTGNSERGIVVEGRRMGHVLDPRTGRPSVDFGSMTVWTESSATADCLATGLYVMGPETALCWAAAQDDVAVVIVQVTDSGLEALASPILEGRLAAAADDIALRFVETPPDCRSED